MCRLRIASYHPVAEKMKSGMYEADNGVEGWREMNTGMADLPPRAQCMGKNRPSRVGNRPLSVDGALVFVADPVM